MRPVFGQIQVKDSLLKDLPPVVGHSSWKKSRLISPPPNFSDNSYGYQPTFSLLQFARVADDYFVRNFGFFCRKELQFEKQTRLPLRFRLGSLDYCNYLEAKR